MQQIRWLPRELHWVKKANPKGHILYGSIYVTFLKGQIIEID